MGPLICPAVAEPLLFDPLAAMGLIDGLAPLAPTYLTRVPGSNGPKVVPVAVSRTKTSWFSEPGNDEIS